MNNNNENNRFTQPSEIIIDEQKIKWFQQPNQINIDGKWIHYFQTLPYYYYPPTPDGILTTTTDNMAKEMVLSIDKQIFDINYQSPKFKRKDFDYRNYHKNNSYEATFNKDYTLYQVIKQCLFLIFKQNFKYHKLNKEQQNKFVYDIIKQTNGHLYSLGKKDFVAKPTKKNISFIQEKIDEASIEFSYIKDLYKKSKNVIKEYESFLKKYCKLNNELSKKQLIAKSVKDFYRLYPKYNDLKIKSKINTHIQNYVSYLFVNF